jgi:hypothetical protein
VIANTGPMNGSLPGAAIHAALVRALDVRDPSFIRDPRFERHGLHAA